MGGVPDRNPLVVIGVGNSDRGDDGLGPLVVARLGELPGARVISLSSDAFGIIEACTGAEAVVLIDAAAGVSGPGWIHRIDLSVDELPCELGLASTHAFGLAEAIALGRALERLPERVVVYAVQGACFDIGAPMTEEVVSAVDEVVSLVTAEVLTLRRPSAPLGKNAHGVECLPDSLRGSKGVDTTPRAESSQHRERSRQNDAN